MSETTAILRHELMRVYCTVDGCTSCEGCQRAKRRVEQLEQQELTVQMLDQLMAVEDSLRA